MTQEQSHFFRTIGTTITCCLAFLPAGAFYASNVLSAPVSAYFDATEAGFYWAIGIGSFGAALMGFFAGRIMGSYVSTSTVLGAGYLITCLGWMMCLLSFFLGYYWIWCLAWALLIGPGLGPLFLPSMALMTSTYAKQGRRGLGVGLAGLAIGLFSAAMSYIYALFLQHSSLIYLSVSMIAFNLVASIFQITCFRTFTDHHSPQPQSKPARQHNNDIENGQQSDENTEIDPSCYSGTSTSSDTGAEEDTCHNTCPSPPSLYADDTNYTSTISPPLQRERILLTAQFWCWFVALTIQMAPGWAFKTLITPILSNVFERGEAFTTVSNVLFFCAWSVARLLVGILSDRIPTKKMYIFMALCQACLLCISPLIVDFMPGSQAGAILFTVVMMCVGMIYAAVQTLWPVMNIILWGIDVLPKTMGWVNFAFGVSGFFGTVSGYYGIIYPLSVVGAGQSHEVIIAIQFSWFIAMGVLQLVALVLICKL